jgi:hypothetical protein
MVKHIQHLSIEKQTSRLLWGKKKKELFKECKVSPQYTNASIALKQRIISRERKNGYKAHIVHHQTPSAVPSTEKRHKKKHVPERLSSCKNPIL